MRYSLFLCSLYRYCSVGGWKGEGTQISLGGKTRKRTVRTHARTRTLFYVNKQMYNVQMYKMYKQMSRPYFLLSTEL